MRTLALAALTMVTAAGATAADAQGFGGRLGRGGAMPGASYPMPGSMPAMQQPGGGAPVNLPPPPSVNTYPGQMNGPRPYPGPNNPGPRPMQPGGWQGGGSQGGAWHGGAQGGTWQGGGSQGGAWHGGSQGGTWQGGSWQGGGTRWGGSVGGRWSGGMNAPGGWNAYRRPSRGYTLPTYWISPSFYISDFGGYGLYAPPSGYGWQRYYDDAVLVDGRGRVRDSVYDVNWDGGYGQDGGYASSDYAYAQGGAGGSGYAYPPQYQGQYQGQYQSLPPVSQQGNVTTYSTGGYAGGAYAAGGYYYPGATTTVVTIQGAPSVTTTTTEYVEETVRTRYVAPRRVYRVKKRVYRPARCACRRAAPVEQPILGS